MSDVKRYELDDLEDFGGPTMNECPDGRWVLHDDYKALASRLDTLQFQLKNLAEHSAAFAAERNEARSRLASVSKLLDDWRYAWDSAKHVDIPEGIEQIRAVLQGPVVEKRRTDSPETNDELADKARWSE